MNNLSDHEFAACQARGLIPGPDESESEFVKRVKSLPPKSVEVKEIFSFRPDWVEITYSNKGLLPWQGGCTWIEGHSLTLQIRKKIFGYDPDEIIRHELVHALRMAYQERVFEEILAYQTSKSWFRKFFGPLFRSSAESLICVVLLSLFSFVNLLYTLPLITSGLTAALLTFFLVRLCKNQRTFSKTLNALKQLYKDKALHIAMQLTDKEISLFSKRSLSEIEEYGKSQKCLRWKFIRL